MPSLTPTSSGHLQGEIVYRKHKLHTIYQHQSMEFLHYKCALHKINYHTKKNIQQGSIADVLEITYLSLSLSAALEAISLQWGGDLQPCHTNIRPDLTFSMMKEARLRSLSAPIGISIRQVSFSYSQRTQ